MTNDSLTPDDRACLAAPLQEAQPPLTPAEIVRVQETWDAIEAPPEPMPDVTQLWARVTASTTQTSNSTAVHKPNFSSIQARTSHRWSTYITLCTAVLLIVTGGLYLVTNRLPKHGAATPQVFATTTGQRAAFQLPDGSRVVLAPESRVQYTAGFGATTRTVTLEGEALFTVVNHAAAPFRVEAAGTVTRVLGTTFSVRHYAADSVVRVTVAQGRVDFHDTVLGTGDVAITRPDAIPTVLRATNVSAALAWAEGRLVLDKVLLRDALPELERWYGLHITADPALLGQRVLVTLDTETPREALDMLAYTLGARLIVQGSRAQLTLMP